VTEWPLGSNIDGIQRCLAPHSPKASIDRQTEAQIGITWDGQTQHQGFTPPVIGLVRNRLRSPHREVTGVTETAEISGIYLFRYAATAMKP